MTLSWIYSLCAWCNKPLEEVIVELDRNQFHPKCSEEYRAYCRRRAQEATDEYEANTKK